MSQSEYQPLANAKLDALLCRDISDSQRALLIQLKNHLHNIGDPEPRELSLDESMDILLLDVEREHPNTAALIRSTLNTLENIGA